MEASQKWSLSRMQMGIKRTAVLPSGDMTTKAVARGPRCCGFLCAETAVNATTSAKVTWSARLRYKGAAMEANDKVPDFSLLDENGKTVSRDDLKGKNVVLYF